MNTFTGPESRSNSLVFLTFATMYTVGLCRGTHMYLSFALKSRVAMISLCSSPSLGRETVSWTWYTTESASRFASEGGAGGGGTTIVGGDTTVGGTTAAMSVGTPRSGDAARPSVSAYTTR